MVNLNDNNAPVSIVGGTKKGTSEYGMFDRNSRAAQCIPFIILWTIIVILFIALFFRPESREESPPPPTNEQSSSIEAALAKIGSGSQLVVKVHEK